MLPKFITWLGSFYWGLSNSSYLCFSSSPHGEVEEDSKKANGLVQRRKQLHLLGAQVLTAQGLSLLLPAQPTLRSSLC